MTEREDAFDRTAVIAPLAIPVLLTTDIERSKSTYAAIGFTVTDTGHPYLIVRGFGVEFHVSKVDLIPEPHCVSAYLRVPEVAPLYEAFKKVDGVLAAPVSKPWGLREFHFIDPDGNLLNIGELI
jgi:catechol 2,3-dioxygenase-like lactoylglutathione lyase family enzyme